MHERDERHLSGDQIVTIAGRHGYRPAGPFIGGAGSPTLLSLPTNGQHFERRKGRVCGIIGGATPGSGSMLRIVVAADFYPGSTLAQLPGASIQHWKDTPLWNMVALLHEQCAAIERRGIVETAERITLEALRGHLPVWDRVRSTLRRLAQLPDQLGAQQHHVASSLAQLAAADRAVRGELWESIERYGAGFAAAIEGACREAPLTGCGIVAVGPPALFDPALLRTLQEHGVGYRLFEPDPDFEASGL